MAKRNWLFYKVFKNYDFIENTRIKAYLLCLSAVILLFILSTINNIVDMRYSFEQKALLTANLIGEQISIDIRENKPQEAQQKLQKLQNSNPILALCAYDAKGRKFAYFRIKAPQKYNCPISPDFGSILTKKYLSLHQAITSNDTYIGSVYVIYDLSSAYLNLLKTILLELIATIIIIFFCHAMLKKIIKSISLPVRKLANDVANISSNHDYTINNKNTIEKASSLINRLSKSVQDTNNNVNQIIFERTKKLEDAKTQAERSNEAKSQFLRSMSHEFRTPMHAISSFCNYGVKEAASSPRQELLKYFERIQSGSNRLLKLIDSMLSIARLESGKEVFLMEQGDILKTINNVITENQSLLSDKNLTIKVLEPECDTKSIFDSDKIAQVITNILGNAIKFSPENTQVTIRISKSIPCEKFPQGATKVAISDNGPGVPESQQLHIFDIFAQNNNNSLKARSGGTGLGLAIASKIIDGHEGKIWVTNNENSGACFQFVIPENLKEGHKTVTITDGDKIGGE